jgi:hypothetical protein
MQRSNSKVGQGPLAVKYGRSFLEPVKRGGGQSHRPPVAGAFRDDLIGYQLELEAIGIGKLEFVEVLAWLGSMTIRHEIAYLT